MAALEKAKSLSIGNVSIHPGERLSLALPAPEFYTCAPIHIPIHVLHGKKKGPVLVICAAMHGDEMSGIGTIQKILNLNLLKTMRGTLIAIPVMNVYGLITQERKIRNRGDLEAVFPGSEQGSFAARLAHLLSKEIFSLATHCILMHTGQPGVRRWPQVHTHLDLSAAKQMAEAFQAPFIMNTDQKKGLLELMYRDRPIPTLIYESGEPMRLDVEGMKVGVKGVVRVMRELEMLPSTGKSLSSTPVLQQADWVLSHNSGLCRFYHHLGAKIKKGVLIARITDPFSSQKIEDVFAPTDGYVIAETTVPIVNEGDPIVQIGQLASEESNSSKQLSPKGESF